MMGLDRPEVVTTHKRLDDGFMAALVAGAMSGYLSPVGGHRRDNPARVHVAPTEQVWPGPDTTTPDDTPGVGRVIIGR
jgi:hypothetical protein